VRRYLKAAGLIDSLHLASVPVLLERFTDAAGHKVESCPAFHNQRLTLVMCQNEFWRMIRRIVSPPSSSMSHPATGRARD